MTCVLGAGMVIDLDHLAGEMDAIEQLGIAYAYSDKYRKKTLRLGDLLHLDEKRVQAPLPPRMP